MTNVIEFLSLRRSVTAKTMAVGNVDPSHLDQILAVGIRVPDHGALKPWRLVVISGAARARLDSEIIHAEFTASNPNAKPEVEEIEKGRLQRADVVIAVLSISQPNEAVSSSRFNGSDWFAATANPDENNAIVADSKIIKLFISRPV